MSTIKQVTVIGAGQMGSGIAQVLASHARKQVVLYDISKSSVERSEKTIAKSLEKLEGKGRLPHGSASDALKNISFTDDLSRTRESQIFIEAIIEKFEVKAELFRALDEIASKEAIFASNTSSIPITSLGRVTKRAEQTIGMHFMNPVPIMSLVEIIRSPLTNDATYQQTVGLAKEMTKETVCSSDSAGFIVNRILMPMINEAFFALHEGVATAEDIDKAMMLGTNQPMGPLTLADFIGLDTCLFILETMHRDIGDPKFRPCPHLRQLVSAGLYGKKSGRGVFTYER